jgi:hypothetical protein
MLSFVLSILTIMSCTWGLAVEFNNWQMSSRTFAVVYIALIAISIRTLSLLLN